MELISVLLMLFLLSFLIMFGISIYEWICYISWRKSIFSVTIFKKKISNIPIRRSRKFDIRILRLDLENDIINKNHTKFLFKFLGEKTIIFRRPNIFFLRYGVTIEPYGLITIDKEKKEIEMSQKVWLTVFYVLFFWVVFGIIIMVTISLFGILLIIIVVIFICSLLYQYNKKVWVYNFLKDKFEK